MRKILPKHWCRKSHVARPNEVHIVFYSRNKNAIPNFNLPIRADFDEESTGCYHGHVLKLFSKCFNREYELLFITNNLTSICFPDDSHSREYMENYSAKARAVLPRNYSEKYLRQNAISHQASNEQNLPNQCCKPRQKQQPRQLKQQRQTDRPRNRRQPKRTQTNDHQIVLAKKEKEIAMLRLAINNLNKRLGDEDLTINKQLETEEHFSFSSDDDSEGEIDPGDGDSNGDECADRSSSVGTLVNGRATENANKENTSSNMQQRKLNDMMFSFSRDYIENVRN